MIKSHKLAIYDEETEYTFHLMDYINRRFDCMYQAGAFSSREAFCEYLKQEKPDVLLIGENFKVPEIGKEIKNNLIYLCNRKEKEGKEYHSIYKYQSASTIIQLVMEYMNPQEEKVEIKQKGEIPILITILSAGNSEKRSEYAREAIRKYAKDEKCLFVDMDLYSTWDQEEKGLSTLLYYIKQEENNLEGKIKELIKKGKEYDYLSPVQWSMDLIEVTETDMGRLVNLLLSCEEYDSIFINAGFFNSSIGVLCSNSERIVFIEGDDREGEQRRKNFIRQLEQLNQIQEKNGIEIIR